MSQTYYLNAVHLDCSSGIVKASVNVSVVDGLTGTGAGFDRAVVNPSPAVQAKLDDIVQQAMAYIQSKIPGLALTLPPITP